MICEDRIKEVFARPAALEKDGTAHALLNCWLKGYRVSALRAFLASGERRIVETGIWIASELGNKSTAVVQDAVSLLSHQSAVVRYYAMEVVVVCAKDDKILEFVHLPILIQDKDIGVAEHAMWLMSSAATDQLKAAHEYYERNGQQDSHTIGLGLLVANAMEIDIHNVLSEWITDNQLLREAYGAIWSQRNIYRAARLMTEVAKSKYELIRRFGERMIVEQKEAADRLANRTTRMEFRARRRQRTQRDGTH